MRWSRDSWWDVLGGEDLHHQVDVIAVDPVEAHPHGGVEDVVVLQVPPEGDALETVEQGDEASGPIGVVQVDGVDPNVGEDRCRPLGSSGESRQSRRVDEADPCVHRAQGDELLDRGGAEPQSTEQVLVRVGDDVDDRVARPLGLEIE